MRAVTALSSITAGLWMTVAAGCIGWTTPLFERQVQVRAVPAAPGPLDVETDNGSIEVARSDGAEVVIDATVRARTQERADATGITAERGPDQTLTVRVRWPEGGRKSNEGCSLRIAVPEADGVRAATSNGRVVVTGMAGPVEIQTSNGGVTVRGHGGRVRARTSNGGITLEGVNGEVDVETTNGAIDIDLAAEAAGPVRAESSNGAIRLRVGQAFAGRLHASTSNGHVRIEGLPNAAVGEVGGAHADVRIGDGEAESSLRTSNGSIHVSGK